MTMRKAALLGLAMVAAAAAYGELAPPAAPKGDVERGRYLAHDVAMCVQCHSPRDASGQLVEGRLFTGAPVPVASPWSSGVKWAAMAPNIAGLTGYSDDEGIRLLTEGIARDGRTPSPPMPPFRMTREDAAAVAAYLRSLR